MLFRSQVEPVTVPEPAAQDDESDKPREVGSFATTVSDLTSMRTKSYTPSIFLGETRVKRAAYPSSSFSSLTDRDELPSLLAAAETAEKTEEQDALVMPDTEVAVVAPLEETAAEVTETSEAESTVAEEANVENSSEEAAVPEEEVPLLMPPAVGTDSADEIASNEDAPVTGEEVAVQEVDAEEGTPSPINTIVFDNAPSSPFSRKKTPKNRR